jgi:3-hydroxyisobutyrate dehydrogenase
MEKFTADRVKLGFIGLGKMGTRIARRLLDHRYHVSVYDRDVSKANALTEQGGVVAKSVLELAGGADVILSCLTNDEVVRSVYTGPEGVFAGRGLEPSCLK